MSERIIPEKDFDMIINPSYYSFKGTLDDYLKDKNKEIANKFIIIWAIPGCSTNPRVLQLLPQLIPFTKDFYFEFISFFAAAVHYNPLVYNILKENDFYQYLDYEIDQTYFFLFCCADNNPEGMKDLENLKIDKNKKYIVDLFK